MFELEKTYWFSHEGFCSSTSKSKKGIPRENLLVFAHRVLKMELEF